MKPSHELNPRQGEIYLDPPITPTPTLPSSPPPPRKRYLPRIKDLPPEAKRNWPEDLIQMRNETLLALDRYRMLTNGQVQTLLFLDRPGPTGTTPRSDKAAREAANTKCLMRLRQMGLIERIRVFHTHPVSGNFFLDGVNILTRAGAKDVEALTGEKPRWTPSLRDWENRSVDHRLMINDFGIALERACAQRGWEVRRWRDDEQLRGSPTAFLDFYPDAIAAVAHQGRIYPLLFEADRGTETVSSRTGSDRDWQTKIERIGRYLKQRLKSDSLWLEAAAAGEQMQAPLVLTVTTKPGRVAAMLAATKAGGGQNAYWYTSCQALYATREHFLAPVWRRWTSEEPLSLVGHLEPQVRGGR